MQTTVHDMFLRRKWIAAICDIKEKLVSSLVSCSRTAFKKKKRNEERTKEFNNVLYNVVRQASCMFPF